MPTYQFDCAQCGLQFKRRAKASKVTEGKTCPSCGATAYAVLPDKVSFGYGVKGDGTPSPQNTGLSSYDNDYDRVLGEDAARAWAVINQRNRYREAVVRDQHPDFGKRPMKQLKRELGLTDEHGGARTMGRSEQRHVFSRRNFHNVVTGLEKDPKREQLLKNIAGANRQGS